MKKLITLLLVMMLPLYAMAETYSLSLYFETDETLFPMVVKQLLQAYPDMDEKNSSAAAELLQYLTDGLALRMTSQENAAAVEANVNGRALIDYSVYSIADEMYVTSSLLPGYVITEHMDISPDDERSMLSVCDAVDWDSIYENMRATFDAWLTGVESSVATGTYSGYTFEDGAKCTTWMLTDSHIASLLSSLASDELRHTVTDILSVIDVDAADLFAQFDAKNKAVADADTYMYILRMVEDQAGKICGMTLTVYEDVEQVATISLGLAEKQVHVVLGLGLETENYWWQFSATKTQRDHTTFYGGTSREWMANKQQEFSYVCTANAPLTNLGWQCSVTHAGTRSLWDFRIFEQNEQAADENNVFLTSSGSVIPAENKMECSIAVGRASDVFMEINLLYELAEAITPLDPALKQFSVSDEIDASLYAELSQKLTATLLARLIKLMPPELLLTLKNLAPIE